MLLRLADLVEADAEELTRLEVEETGKPAAVFRDGELPFAVDNLRFFAGAARSTDGSGAGVFSAGYTSVMLRRPVGVVGSISPWNFPFIMAVWKVGPAVAAGNAVVIKPAPRRPARRCVWRSCSSRRARRRTSCRWSSATPPWARLWSRTVTSTWSA